MAIPVLTRPERSIRVTNPLRLPRSSRRRRDAVVAYLLIAPAITYFLLFLLYPALAALYYSFTDWNMRTSPTWIGLANYHDLFFNRVKFPYFWQSVKVTAMYTVVAVPLTMVVALVQALLLNSIRRGASLFRLLLFMPMVSAEVAVGVVWRWLYDPGYGLLNAVLGLVGIPAQNWLDDPDLIVPALAFISTWQCGISMLIYLAGLKAIPAGVREAAVTDGASWRQRFRYVTVPMLRPATFYLLVTNVIAALQVFALVYVIFNRAVSGGTGQAGLTYVLHLYLFAFRYDAMGAACAMSFILFVFILIVTAVQFRFVRQQTD
jgi:multiple sugar transport system permease protein